MWSANCLSQYQNSDHSQNPCLDVYSCKLIMIISKYNYIDIYIYIRQSTQPYDIDCVQTLCLMVCTLCVIVTVRQSTQLLSDHVSCLVWWSANPMLYSLHNRYIQYRWSSSCTKPLSNAVMVCKPHIRQPAQLAHHVMGLPHQTEVEHWQDRGYSEKNRSIQIVVRW